MTVNNHLYFLSDIGRNKIIHQNNEGVCPFCMRDELSNILAEDGPIILLENKFPTLANAYQTVLIETDDCSTDIMSYDQSHMRKIIHFGTDYWMKMGENADFKSVVFYKNHGPLSGGTIKHSHMQIVGLKDIDYKQNLNDDVFVGLEIYKEGNGVLNISTKPKVSTIEFNIITRPRDDNFMADSIQRIVKYIQTDMACSSYNLFFYQWNESIICKIVPRYVSSPFFVGYSISQISSRVNEVATEIKNKYFQY